MKRSRIGIGILFFGLLVLTQPTLATAETPFPCSAVREAYEKLPSVDEDLRTAKRIANRGIRLLDDFINDPTFNELGPHVRRRILEYREALEQRNIDAGRVVNQATRLAAAYAESLNYYCGGV